MEQKPQQTPARPRGLSEDIPESLREIMSEIPLNSQSLLFVDEVQGMTTSQQRAEERFLEKKNVRQQMRESTNSYDYEYLRKLLKAAPCDALYIERKASGVTDRPVVECCHRSYENEFLREPKRNERACCNDNCEGLHITTTDEGFVLREFLLPSQFKRFLETKELPKMRQLCLMCRRAEVARLYVCMRADGDTSSALISDMRNFGSVAGEYCLDQMLLPSTTNKVGLFDPIVAHCRKHYTLTKIGGIRYYAQTGYRKPVATPFTASHHFLNRTPLL
tara:strand:+ start:78 stop:908 length:831 start_codon:yes stop_codon:yes gene_type:complete